VPQSKSPERLVPKAILHESGSELCASTMLPKNINIIKKGNLYITFNFVVQIYTNRFKYPYTDSGSNKIPPVKCCVKLFPSLDTPEN
jgi:hypothetical protein